LQTSRTDWNQEARRILKFELARRDLTYKQLLKKLQDVGVEGETEIVNKVSRGTFSFAFFLMCMRALDVEHLDIGGLTERSSRVEKRN
jgi:hypothetical protein